MLDKKKAERSPSSGKEQLGLLDKAVRESIIQLGEFVINHPDPLLGKKLITEHIMILYEIFKSLEKRS